MKKILLSLLMAPVLCFAAGVNVNSLTTMTKVEADALLATITQYSNQLYQLSNQLANAAPGGGGTAEALTNSNAYVGTNGEAGFSSVNTAQIFSESFNGPGGTAPDFMSGITLGGGEGVFDDLGRGSLANLMLSGPLIFTNSTVEASTRIEWDAEGTGSVVLWDSAFGMGTGIDQTIALQSNGSATFASGLILLNLDGSASFANGAATISDTGFLTIDSLLVRTTGTFAESLWVGDGAIYGITSDGTANFSSVSANGGYAYLAADGGAHFGFNEGGPGGYNALLTGGLLETTYGFSAYDTANYDGTVLTANLNSGFTFAFPAGSASVSGNGIRFIDESANENTLNQNGLSLAVGTITINGSSAVLNADGSASFASGAVTLDSSGIKGNGISITNLSLAVTKTNLDPGVVICSTNAHQIFVTNATYTVSGFRDLRSGWQHVFSQTISNSHSSAITWNGPPSTFYFGSVSSAALSIPAGKEAVVSFWIWPNIRTNACNAVQQ